MEPKHQEKLLFPDWDFFKIVPGVPDMRIVVVRTYLLCILLSCIFPDDEGCTKITSDRAPFSLQVFW